MIREDLSPDASSLAGDAFPEPGLAGRLYASDLFILGGALLFVAVVPELLHPSLAQLGRLFIAYEHVPEPALVAVVLATCGFHLAMRQIWRLPFTSSAMFVFSAVGAMFAIAAATFKLLAIPIGFYHFWTGLVACTLWYLFVLSRRRELLRPVLGLVGQSFGDGLALSLPAHCLKLTRPVLHPQITALVVADEQALSPSWKRFLAGTLQRGIPVYHLDHLIEEMTARLDLDSCLHGNFGALMPSGDYLYLKRLLDTLAALALLPLLLPLLLLLALAVRLSSSGPVIVGMPCTGLGGCEFQLLGFRVRNHVGHGSDEPDQAMTTIGLFLYRNNLVYLPAVINVLKGDMSWIGPRPQATAVNRMRDAQYPFHGYRHCVRPGLLGWARAYMGRKVGAAEGNEELAYDLFYVKHISFWLDCIVTLKSISLFLKRSFARSGRADR